MMRDERTAAGAADAYARVSGRIGVCEATVGPGATNLVSGLAEAYASAIPVLAIVADVKTEREHLRVRGVASQAMEQQALLQGVTKRSEEHTSELQSLLRISYAVFCLKQNRTIDEQQKYKTTHITSYKN